MGQLSGQASSVRQSLKKQFGQFLRRVRGSKTLRDFGREAGLSRSHLQRLEQGDQNLSLDTLERVLRRLGVTIRDVFRD